MNTPNDPMRVTMVGYGGAMPPNVQSTTNMPLAIKDMFLPFNNVNKFQVIDAKPEQIDVKMLQKNTHRKDNGHQVRQANDCKVEEQVDRPILDKSCL